MSVSNRRMSDGMANPSKAKGDRAEREAVEVLKSLAPNLCVADAIRMLGAGRKDDVGDLRVFVDVAIQVRNYKMDSIGSAIRTAASDSVVQASNGSLPIGLGMVPVPGARKNSVRWLAACHTWPTALWDEGGLIQPEEFKMVGRALNWLRDETGTYDRPAVSRQFRVAVLVGKTPVLISPIEAWLEAYAVSKRSPLVCADDVAFELPHESTQEGILPQQIA